MSRPRKRRRVCDMPKYRIFGPINGRLDGEETVLSIEEYETIRLIDFEGLEQQECAERMEVGRSTVQRMYKKAKKKLADSLVNGKIIKIEGGDYLICDLVEEKCTPCNRGRHRHRGGRKERE